MTKQTTKKVFSLLLTLSFIFVFFGCVKWEKPPANDAATAAGEGTASGTAESAVNPGAPDAAQPAPTADAGNADANAGNADANTGNANAGNAGGAGGNPSGGTDSFYEGGYEMPAEPETVFTPEWEQYTSLAVSDFHSIRGRYPEAVGLHAYVVVYTVDTDGVKNDYALTYVVYQIISQYNATILHNFTTGETIEDPVSYYEELANRHFGGQHIQYMEQANIIREQQATAIDDILNILTTGSQYGPGVYVDAETLNR